MGEDLRFKNMDAGEEESSDSRLGRAFRLAGDAHDPLSPVHLHGAVVGLGILVQENHGGQSSRLAVLLDG